MRGLKIIKQVTDRSDLSLDKYLFEISKSDLLTPEKEAELAKRIRKGDEEALTELINSNLRFVVSVAKQYQRQGVALADLINEGNLGLIKAAQKFDERRGFKFISYAVWWIRQTILSAIAEQSRIVRLPQNKVGQINKINRAIKQLEQELQDEPSVEQIAELISLPEDIIQEMQNSPSNYLSFDAPVAGGGDLNVGDLFISSANGPESVLVNEDLKKEVERSLSLLSERQAAILRLYFGIDCLAHTLEEIGEKFGLTKERVRQIKEKAIRRLQVSYRNRNLKEYL